MARKSRNNNTSAQGAVRIIGGQWRGRKLPVHAIDGLRPTGDRVRETLFNWLSENIYDAKCLDLFAGSGALGFEAASRGAKQICLLELNHLATKQLLANQQLLAADNIDIINTNAITWLSQYQQESFDIVFIDPPFEQNLWKQTLTTLCASTAVSKTTILYIEHPKTYAVALPKHWYWLKQKTAGDTGFGLATQQ